jgi:hypothetical protein
MANEFTNICKAIKGFVLTDKEDTREIFKAIKFEDNYAFASDTTAAAMVKTHIPVEEAEMRNVKGDLVENLDPGYFPDFDKLINDRKYDNVEPAIVDFPKKIYKSYEWKHLFNFMKSAIYLPCKRMVFEKRGRNLLAYAVNESIKVKAVLATDVVGGVDISFAVNAKYLSATAELLDFLKCDKCQLFYTNDVSHMIFRGYLKEELMCTIIVAPIRVSNRDTDELWKFRNSDITTDSKSCTTDDEEWDFLEEE